MAKVYLYKEYDDSYAYGDEVVETYKDKDQAKERLADRMVRWIKYRTGKEYTFEDILNNVDNLYDENDCTVTDEYISVPDKRGGWLFFVVEEKELIERAGKSPRKPL